MENNTEKAGAVRNLKRVGDKKFQNYESAKAWQDAVLKNDKHEVQPAKVKIFARYDGTFDVVTYIKINQEPEAAPVVAEKKNKRTKNK